MTRDELLDALLVERYNGGGWKTPEARTEPRSEPEPIEDDDVTIARRKRDLLAAVAHVQISEKEVGTG